VHNNRILRERVAGQSAMAAVVRAQATAPRPGRLARILGVSPLSSEARSHYRGALGELFVGDVLENLGPTWDVLHDLPVGDSVVDHLLIGRAGVFTVRAANYGRDDVLVDGASITVGGERRDDIPAAAAEAAEVSRVLSAAAGREIRVRPLLVVVDPIRLTIRTTPSDVRVVASRELEGAITHAPRTLTGEEVALVSDLADLESTWPVSVRADERLDTQHLDTQQLHRDFGTIRTTVNDSLARRVLWGSAVTLAVSATMCSIIATLVTTVVNS
jgi:hypothetical protein